VDETIALAERFEEHRGHLRAVAYRMLGSLGEADDALQEAWIRVSRAGADGVHNIGGWLTTAVHPAAPRRRPARRPRGRPHTRTHRHPRSRHRGPGRDGR
jgi:DNA-directed RNA polymerase specialized sigma24 family protein